MINNMNNDPDYLKQDVESRWRNDEDYLLLNQITNEVIEKYKNKIIKILADYSSENWFSSNRLFILCLDENRLDLAHKFRVSFSEEILEKYNSQIKHIIEIDFPYNWKSQGKVLEYLLKNNYNNLIQRINSSELKYNIEKVDTQYQKELIEIWKKGNELHK